MDNRYLYEWTIIYNNSNIQNHKTLTGEAKKYENAYESGIANNYTNINFNQNHSKKKNNENDDKTVNKLSYKLFRIN